MQQEAKAETGNRYQWLSSLILPAELKGKVFTTTSLFRLLSPRSDTTWSRQITSLLFRLSLFTAYTASKQNESRYSP